MISYLFQRQPHEISFTIKLPSFWHILLYEKHPVETQQIGINTMLQFDISTVRFDSWETKLASSYKDLWYFYVWEWRYLQGDDK